MDAKTKEKIYIGAIVVLGILLLLKNKKKCPPCLSCSDQGDTVINVPPIQQTISQEIVEEPTMDPKEQEAMQVYSGPSKFKVASPSKEDPNATWIYFVDAGKFYKYYNSTTNPLGYDSKVEISKQEIVNAWNSVNN